MEFGGAPIVSLPIGGIEPYCAAIAQWRAGIVRMPALVEAVFGKRVVASIGPAFVGYSDLKRFQRIITSKDAKPAAKGNLDLYRNFNQVHADAVKLGF